MTNPDPDPERASFDDQPELMDKHPEAADEETARFLDRIRQDPPRIESLDELKPVVQQLVGNRAFIHSMDHYEDGRVVAYLGVVYPRNTQDDALGDREITFVNVAPVGALTVTPAEDGDGYRVDVPDRDALEDACQRRRELEADHRLQVVPAIKNLLEERQEMYYAEAGEYGFHDIDSFDDLDLEGPEWFALGRAVGAHQMASLVHRVLMRRLRGAYAGCRRWESPEYEVIRDRRTASILEGVPDDSDH